MGSRTCQGVRLARLVQQHELDLVGGVGLQVEEFARHQCHLDNELLALGWNLGRRLPKNKPHWRDLPLMALNKLVENR